jgi:hypothetical protein
MQLGVLLAEESTDNPLGNELIERLLDLSNASFPMGTRNTAARCTAEEIGWTEW